MNRILRLAFCCLARKKWYNFSVSAGADPGFPVRGDADFPGGHQHTILLIFPQKLHEIEKILSPLDPPLFGLEPQKEILGSRPIFVRIEFLRFEMNSNLSN